IETARVMLAVANRESEGWLRTEDAENFPCKELRTIDNLWLKYSQGKFGISVRQEIYKNLGGTKLIDVNVWRSFGNKVGWRKQGSWLDSSDLSAPTRCRPIRVTYRGTVRKVFVGICVLVLGYFCFLFVLFFFIFGVEKKRLCVEYGWDREDLEWVVRLFVKFPQRIPSCQDM
ncbi:GUN4 domain-containing protein, partial [Cylindrospermopsis raciborskii]|uniref:GUN4 domain-containing protein n=1 Tax=Cylindrospermopsis raciborskii TaxID=77022 RepID=UPI002154FD87